MSDFDFKWLIGSILKFPNRLQQKNVKKYERYRTERENYRSD
jgi:hypothetical protein